MPPQKLDLKQLQQKVSEQQRVRKNWVRVRRYNAGSCNKGEDLEGQKGW